MAARFADPSRRAGGVTHVAATVDLGVGEPVEMAAEMAAAVDPTQSVLAEAWTLDGIALVPELPAHRDGDGAGGERIARIVTDGRPVTIAYTASVALLDRPPIGPLTFAARLRWTTPSRYCPSDLVGGLARAEFGQPAAADAIRAVAEWVHHRTEYLLGSSDATTTAVETLGMGVGVCRDFAHLTITLLRALGVPARYVAAYAPELEPRDFHALVEAHDGDRWQLVDATGLSDPTDSVRIATGRDGADVPFLSVLAGTTAIEQIAVSAWREDPTELSSR